MGQSLGRHPDDLGLVDLGQPNPVEVLSELADQRLLVFGSAHEKQHFELALLGDVEEAVLQQLEQLAAQERQVQDAEQTPRVVEFGTVDEACKLKPVRGLLRISSSVVIVVQNSKWFRFICASKCFQKIAVSVAWIISLSTNAKLTFLQLNSSSLTFLEGRCSSFDFLKMRMFLAKNSLRALILSTEFLVLRAFLSSSG